jgi:hypothetical protein
LIKILAEAYGIFRKNTAQLMLMKFLANVHGIFSKKNREKKSLSFFFDIEYKAFSQ